MVRSCCLLSETDCCMYMTTSITGFSILGIVGGTRGREPT